MANQYTLSEIHAPRTIEYVRRMGWVRTMAAKRNPKTGAGGKKRRRRKMKLTLRSRSIKKDESHGDRVGWSQIDSPQAEVPTGPIAPEVIRHQCTMCGAMNQIPKPKRDRYKIECANPDCGNVDKVGII